MNVFAYVTLVTLTGVVAGYYVGRRMSAASGFEATMAFLVLSPILGIALAAPLCFGILKLCSLFGITEERCINTDSGTIWYLAVPFVFFPGYAIAMYVGRAFGSLGR